MYRKIVAQFSTLFMLLFLASERARYITGTTIMVDGGLTKGIF